MGANEDVTRAERLANGPLQLPRTITAAQKTIRLFVSYLNQEATSREILELAERGTFFGSKVVREDVRQALREIKMIGIPSNDEKLRELVAHAVSLLTVHLWARRINNPNILPEKALIPSEVLDACLEAYHDWVEQCSLED